MRLEPTTRLWMCWMSSTTQECGKPSRHTANGPPFPRSALQHSPCGSCMPCAHSATTHPCSCLPGCGNSKVPAWHTVLRAVLSATLLVSNLDNSGSFASGTTSWCTLGSLGQACTREVQAPWLGSLIESCCSTCTLSQHHQGRLR